MIFGIGTDLVEIDRVAATYRRFGTHFLDRLLLPAERVAFERLGDREARRIRFLGQRFAAKEAIVKALGTGFAHGMWIRDCGVASNAWGARRSSGRSAARVPSMRSVLAPAT